jgi:hypothetical protein
MVKQHTVYKTVNTKNARFYIGVHLTDNPHDDYLGSGKVLEQAIKKYGRDAFIKEILHVFANAREAFNKEEELVNLHKDNPLCYNLRKGGAGGFDYINLKGLQRQTKNRPMGKVMAERFKKDIKTRKRITAMLEKGRKSLNSIANDLEAQRKGREAAQRARIGSHHSPETKEILRKKAIGRASNTKWMHKGGAMKRVKSVNIEMYQEQGWVFGCPNNGHH